jgi:sortase A
MSRLARRRTAAVVVAAGLLVGACGTADPVVETSPATAAVPAAVAAPAPPPVAAKTIGLSTPLPALPVPGPLPLDAYAPTPEVVLGRLRIPTLGVDEPLQEGMTLTAINRGPSHWPGTAAPGELGNMVIAGHRTTYSRPFHDLDLVAPGDEMVIELADRTVTYVATATEIVTPESLWIADQSWGYTATTFACHPKGSARERIVVFWQLVDDDGVAVPGPAVPPGVVPPAAHRPGAQFAVMPGDELGPET